MNCRRQPLSGELSEAIGHSVRIQYMQKCDIPKNTLRETKLLPLKFSSDTQIGKRGLYPPSFSMAEWLVSTEASAGKIDLKDEGSRHDRISRGISHSNCTLIKPPIDDDGISILNLGVPCLAHVHVDRNKGQPQELSIIAFFLRRAPIE